MTVSIPLPQRPIEDLPGHWLLARLGKRVLRPGGRGMTETLLSAAKIPGADVVELAPGLGKTAALILEGGPRSYTGVDEDPDAVLSTRAGIGGRGTVHEAPAAETGLGDASADLVVGEAMLTMQSPRGKDAIVAEAHRVLRAGGRYAIHELAIEPDTLDDEQKTEIRKALARSIKVNARPLTEREWTELFEKHGFRVETVRHADMALLEARRNLEDEGLRGVLTIVVNLLRNPGARKRVLEMRSVFRRHRDNMSAIALVAVKQ
ncbi:class I SAM-dependent methyltransferase [Tomitella fengzijianii]|uniref:Methyltransferase domain-containing protein n=1 Tax=Tomitella fengzijianii TaxID=2597660 RepID=A0A516X044_9ACTN|nr:class I SAM-dependent methyltransferase [Tomitella fengzijianii]QDQ96469.1 methyltransferase domain-containing protein [Tomitella fengzijianii]